MPKRPLPLPLLVAFCIATAVTTYAPPAGACQACVPTIFYATLGEVVCDPEPGTVELGPPDWHPPMEKDPAEWEVFPLDEDWTEDDCEELEIMSIAGYSTFLVTDAESDGDIDSMVYLYDN